MPPEFLTDGQYDPRDETVWRLGIVTYYLLTGCRPYKDTQEALLRSEATHLKYFSKGTLNLERRILQLKLFGSIYKKMIIFRGARSCEKNVVYHS
jgi:serine/threonine protein kinase